MTRGAAQADMPPRLAAYFASRSWSPFEFQTRAWSAYLAGQSGLIHAPTGQGKTLAAWLGPVIERLVEMDGLGEGPSPALPRKRAGRESGEPLRILWITPLRALASDTLDSLLEPVKALGLAWTVEKRTGDTSSTLKKKQRTQLPTALVTTPESVSLLLSYPEARAMFAGLRCVIVDEWHELLGSKRGVQTELALARLRSFCTHARGLRVWGVSATLGNLNVAMDVLMGTPAAGSSGVRGVLVQGRMDKPIEIRTVIPKDIERFPWSGHLGLRSIDEVIEAINGVGRERAAPGESPSGATLLFTNTRWQAEVWFRRILERAPELLGAVAIHHGSLDRKIRDRVEEMLSTGRLRCVVCTSSLDLGVDFAPVEQVIQLGSPKGVGRLVQRAGRSGHRPGATSVAVCVPTHAFELVEFAGARDSARKGAGAIEGREPVLRPMDVLVQHLVTVACGGGFLEAELLEEVRGTHAFAGLGAEQWTWAMDFVRRGGPALTAYPEYAKIGPDATGRYLPVSDRIARQHRLTIGTITGELSMTVRLASGKTLGTIEESFLARLPVGARFLFAGRTLELLRVREMSAYVRPAKSRSGIAPRWNGGRFPLSSQLALAVRAKLEEARRGVFDCPEMEAARPLLELQARWSSLPTPTSLLIERCTMKLAGARGKTIPADTYFVYPFEGRQVHEGLGALLAYRISKIAPITITTTVSDYGICVQASGELDVGAEEWRRLLSSEGLMDDLIVCLNTTELSRRQFRDIARIAGLIAPGFPGAKKPMRHVQASTEMFFEVLDEFDPGNLLLDQARREVLESQLEVGRLRGALERAGGQELVLRRIERLTPMAFPIWAETLRAIQVSSEKWSALVGKMVVDLEEAADEIDGARARRKNGRGRPNRTVVGG